MIDASDESGEAATSATSSCPVDHASATGEASTPKHKLTPREIVGSSVTFLLAGYETTANTLSYTSYLLAINPDIQAKLQSEIDSYFDDKPVSSISQKAHVSVIAMLW
jgi:cytochrome P450